jgi:hypothetical protein
MQGEKKQHVLFLRRGDIYYGTGVFKSLLPVPKIRNINLEISIVFQRPQLCT